MGALFGIPQERLPLIAAIALLATAKEAVKHAAALFLGRRLGCLRGGLGRLLGRLGRAGEEATDRIAEEHAAGYAHGGLQGASHEAATLGAGLLLEGVRPAPGQALSAGGAVAPTTARGWAGLSGGRWLATTPEQPTQETAAALGALGQLALQILDLGLEILQALLLHQDHLGQEIGGGGLAGHEAVDQGLGLGIARRIVEIVGASTDSVVFVSDRPGHDLRYSLDCRKIRALGFRPRVGFDEGLASTVRWYRRNEAWWRPIKEGQFKRYYEKLYRERLRRAGGAREHR